MKYTMLSFLGTTLTVVIGFVLIVVVVIVKIYNALVGLRNRVKNAYAQIDVQLKRRYDLIPNLVETAKGYMKHESETLGRSSTQETKRFRLQQPHQRTQPPQVPLAILLVQTEL